ncbi:hypothetical protein ACQEVF_42240 [Nonomuraea polychroma]
MLSRTLRAADRLLGALPGLGSGLGRYGVAFDCGVPGSTSAAWNHS